MLIVLAHWAGHLGIPARLCGSGAELVAGGAGDPVLASHRARAAAGASDRGTHAFRIRRPDEHPAAVVPAARAPSVLQHRGLRADDDWDVLPPVPQRARSRAHAVHLFPASPLSDNLIGPI